MRRRFLAECLATISMAVFLAPQLWAATTLDEGQDTKILEADQLSPWDLDPEWGWDTEDDGPDTPAIGLLQFEIPQTDLDLIKTAQDVTALLRLEVVNEGDAGNVHRMLMPWDDTFVWDDFGPDGIVPGDNANETATATTGGPGFTGQETLDVSADVLAWANGEPNYGWGFLPTGGNGRDIASFEDLDGRVPTLVLAGKLGTVIQATSKPNTNTGHNWKYFDSITEDGDYPSRWNTESFDDSSWPSGPAILGVGKLSGNRGEPAIDSAGGPDDLPFGTVIADGSNSAGAAQRKRFTDLFRTTFDIPADVDPNDAEGLIFELLAEDAAVVYINGEEVARPGMDPSEAVTATSRSVISKSGVAESTHETVVVSFDGGVSNPLKAGTNTVAVELHQRTSSNNDRGFDMGLSLLGPLGSIPFGPPATGPALQAGDADMDLDFDPLDLVKVQIAAKYLTFQPATWGDGDWDGAPGGSPGDPPTGNGFFDQLDIIAANLGGAYLQGPYAALAGPGEQGDGQTSLVYNAGTGELSVDAPAGKELTSINITSEGSKFVGDKPAALDGAFDNFAGDNVFKATFGGSFGSINFGSILPAGISEADVTADLSAVGSLAGGGDLGEVDLVYIPEPASVALMLLGLLGVAHLGRRKR